RFPGQASYGPSRSPAQEDQMATATVAEQEQSDILSASPQGVEHQPGSRPALITAVSPADVDQVLAMLSRCSSGTLYRRFHGVTAGVAYTRQLLTAGRSQDS